MTSSLVGSEMCIRDRPYTLLHGETGRDISGYWHRRRLVRPETGGDLPVSYTHLTLPTICSV
eukprot:11769295-Prorocentrum_lima.AAC.1